MDLFKITKELSFNKNELVITAHRRILFSSSFLEGVILVFRDKLLQFPTFHISVGEYRYTYINTVFGICLRTVFLITNARNFPHITKDCRVWRNVKSSSIKRDIYGSARKQTVCFNEGNAIPDILILWVISITVFLLIMKNLPDVHNLQARDMFKLLGVDNELVFTITI